MQDCEHTLQPHVGPVLISIWPSEPVVGGNPSPDTGPVCLGCHGRFTKIKTLMHLTPITKMMNHQSKYRQNRNSAVVLRRIHVSNMVMLSCVQNNLYL